jgi:hypothetical protein
MKTFKTYISEQIVNEISDKVVDTVRRKRFNATNADRKNKEKSAAFQNNTKLVAARTNRQRKQADKDPNIQRIKKDANTEYEYNKSKGFTNEDVAVPGPTNVTGPQSGTDPVSATAVNPKKRKRLFITKRTPPKM